LATQRNIDSGILVRLNESLHGSKSSSVLSGSLGSVHGRLSTISKRLESNGPLLSDSGSLASDLVRILSPQVSLKLFYLSLERCLKFITRGDKSAIADSLRIVALV